MKSKFQRLDFSGYRMTDESRESLDNYFVHGLDPGGFMTAVLSNDLYDACARADSANINLLQKYSLWIVNHAPHGSYGDRDTVQGWLRKNEHFERFQKELVAERLRTPESALNDPLF